MSGLRLEFQGTPSHIGSSVDNRGKHRRRLMRKLTITFLFYHNKITRTPSFVSGQSGGHFANPKFDMHH
jgi:hypothetical protein